MDLPTLQAVTARTWGKENELKVLKAELATLDQKITAELAPKQEKQDFGEEVKSDEIQKVEVRDNPSQTTNKRESLVAEAQIQYGFTPTIKNQGVHSYCSFRGTAPKL